VILNQNKETIHYSSFSKVQRKKTNNHKRISLAKTFSKDTKAIKCLIEELIQHFKTITIKKLMLVNSLSLKN
jgi:hypothetical protein